MDKIILIGGSSELAQQTAQLLSIKYNVTTLSRKEFAVDTPKNIYIREYSTLEINKYIQTLNKSDAHTFVFFNGVSDTEIFVNMSDEEIIDLVNANLMTPILFTKACLKKFIPKRTKYIYLTSTRALNGDKGIALYSTTKSALKYLARSLSLEYGRLNQFFYVISLGIFNYGLIKRVNNTALERIQKNSALKGYIDPQQLVNTIEFLMNSDASTGSVIRVDNGYF